MVYLVMEWGDDYHGSRPVSLHNNVEDAKAKVNSIKRECEECGFQHWYSVDEFEIEE